MSGLANRLHGLLQELRADWEQTRPYWADAKALEFEQRFLQPLTQEVNQTLAALEALERLLRQIRRDCE